LEVLLQFHHRLELLCWHGCIICSHSITLVAATASGTAPGSPVGHVWGWAAAVGGSKRAQVSAGCSRLAVTAA
jgi:hypothetical protein